MSNKKIELQQLWQPRNTEKTAHKETQGTDRDKEEHIVLIHREGQCSRGNVSGRGRQLQ